MDPTAKIASGVTDVLTQTLLGTLLLGAILVIRHLYLANGALKEKADVAVAALQEKRIEELRKSVETLGKNEVAMSKMADSVDRLEVTIAERISRGGH